MQYQIMPNGNLALKLIDAADREMLQALLERHEGDDKSLMADLLEETGWGNNGHFEMVLPETVNALTDGILLSDEIGRNEQGDIDYVGNVWWDSNYQVKHFAETLLRDGICFFLAAPENTRVLH